MKFFSLKNLFCILMLSVAFCFFDNPLSAQAGNVGSWPPDVEIVPKCVDSADLGSNYVSYYELQVHRTGFATVTTFYRGDGTTFTPPVGKKTIGNCPTTTTIVKDSIKTLEILHLCDENLGSTIGFYRLIQRTYWPPTGVGTINLLSTIDKNGAAYTVVGTVYDEPCFGYELPTVELAQEITTSVNYNSAQNYESWAVTNVGTTIITVTLTGGSAVNLYPGETRTCNATQDLYRKMLRICPQLTVNATGGTAHVYVRSKL